MFRKMRVTAPDSRQIYDIADPDLAVEFVDQLTHDLCDAAMPPEVR